MKLPARYEKKFERDIVLIVILDKSLYDLKKVTLVGVNFSIFVRQKFTLRARVVNDI